MMSIFVKLLIVSAFISVVVIFVHDLGHFAVARSCRAAVAAFSVGFGAELFGWNDRRGTRWKICAIPVGGYLAFADDKVGAGAPNAGALSGGNSATAGMRFGELPLGRRVLIAAAGPVASFILATVVLASLLVAIGRPIATPKVDQITPGSAAEAAGFKVGDLVLSIDGAPVESFSDMQRITSAGAGRPLAFLVRRGDRDVTLTATPEPRETKDGLGNVHRFGLLGISRQVGPGEMQIKHYGPVAAVALAGQQVYSVAQNMLNDIGGMILGRESNDQLSGPIGIAGVSNRAMNTNLFILAQSVAYISIGIGLINLLPIPPLDGGRLLYCGIEAVRGRPLSERAWRLGSRIAVAAAVALLSFILIRQLHGMRLL